MIDPLQIIQVSLYTKILNEFSTKLKLNHSTILWLIFIYFFYQLWCMPIIQEKVKLYIHKCFMYNISSFTVQGHRKVYTTGFGGNKQFVHILYSEKFRAITHYLLTHNIKEIYNFKETLKLRYNTYGEEEKTEYVLMPEYNQKILLCPTRHIYIEIGIHQENIMDEKEKAKNSYMIHSYKLFIHQQNKYHILNDFVLDCVNIYNADISDKKIQKIFEYSGTYKDDYEKITLQFHEYSFKSNKLLDKNIYFEGKEKLIEYVDKFKVNKTEEKSCFEKEYECAGVTFKASMLLRGPPGCGKSCTIRGILNRTGRHGVVVSWSKLKTCKDFCSLFRNTKINDKEYSMSELCFIFEDFDANKSDILKNRISKPCGNCDDTKLHTLIDKYEKEETNEEQIKILKEINTLTIFNKKVEDELTLECVLNVLDGIIELHNAMIIFTTNHLENIDPAFTRSGRIDFHQEFKLASVSIIKEMLTNIRGIDCLREDYQVYFEKMVDYLISPADVQTICFKYTNADAIPILNDIIELCIQKNSVY